MTTAHSAVDAYCQSCGMPLTAPEQFGTEAGGEASADYCVYCYEDGAFKQPDMTLAGMVELCVPFLVETGMDRGTAQTILERQLPALKRWSASDASLDGAFREANSSGVDGASGEPDRAGLERASGEALAATAPSQATAPVRIERLDGFTIAGLSVVTTNAKELAGAGKISGLWGRLHTSGLFAHPPAGAVQDGRTYGCYFNYENGDKGNYEVLAGVEVKGGSALPDGLTSFTLPSANYAVFTTAQGPLQQVVEQAWAGIWAWSQQSNAERAFTGDFELYDERSADPSNAVVDIYIALK